MGKKVILKGLKLKYSGVLNFRKFYRTIIDFLSDEGFDVYEKHYEEVLEDDGSKTVKVDLYAEKLVTDYVLIFIDMFLQVEGLTKVIIKEDGKEIQMDKVKSLLFLVRQSGVQTDVPGFFETKPFGLFLQELYEKYVVKEDHINKAVGEIFVTTYKLLDKLRDVIGAAGKYLG